MSRTIFGTLFGTIPPYFFGIVPIKKGQAVLPVLWARHPLKRCKYEFLPHAMSALRSSCLTRQPFHAVLTEFEICFLCLLHLILCVVKWVDFQAFLWYTEGRKKHFAQSPAGFTIWRKPMRVSLMTTPLTTYGSGLPGLHAAKSTRKQSIRTQKPRKAHKIT